MKIRKCAAAFKLSLMLQNCGIVAKFFEKFMRFIVGLDKSK